MPTGSGENKQQDFKERRSQASRLIDIARVSELFHTPEGVAYACLKINGHREIWATASRTFRENLVRAFYLQTGFAPSSQAVREAIATLEGIARFDGDQHDVHVRVAGDDHRIWLDLANANWEVVEVSNVGWRVISDPPVRFRRAPGMLPLPIPEPGGSMLELRPFINVSSVDAWSLILSWCVSALRPNGPYVILYLLGEQGSAKSSASRVIRDLIDPYRAPLRATPREERDLYVTANNSRLIAFDNVSRLDSWLSDALCRLATGGGFATRMLYTDAEEVLFEAMRPIILNGITEGVSRGDFLERSIMVTLPTITEATRCDEAGFWKAFELARPRILGALLYAVSTALRRVGSIKLAYKPRMADFAIWSTAAESGLGFEPGTFERAYNSNRQAANHLALESKSVSPFILQLVKTTGIWSGTFTELLTELNCLLGRNMPERKPKDWPDNPRKLSADMQRLAPNLRAVGVECTLSEPGRTRTRTVMLRKCDARISAISAASA